LLGLGYEARRGYIDRDPSGEREAVVGQPLDDGCHYRAEYHRSTRDSDSLHRLSLRAPTREHDTRESDPCWDLVEEDSHEDEEPELDRDQESSRDCDPIEEGVRYQSDECPEPDGG